MRNSRAAFTLFELVVSMGITVVLALLAFSFMQGIIDVWKTSDTNMSVESEVQLALDIMARDLESAVFRENFGTMFAATVLSDLDKGNSDRWDDMGMSIERPIASSFDPAEHRYGWAGTWIRFFSAQPSLNAVAYQLIRSPFMTAATEPGYHWFRSVVRQDYTAKAGLVITDPSPDPDPSWNYETGLPGGLGHPEEVRAPRKENIFLTNVIDFGIRLFVYDDTALDGDPIPAERTYVPTGMRIIFPADASNNLNASDDEHLGETFGTADRTIQYPDVVEIIVRVIDSEGAEKLLDLEENGGDPNLWYQIVDEHSSVHRRFVEVQGGSF